MFKWILLAAFLLSVLFCARQDFVAQRKLEGRRVLLAQRRAELHTLRDFDREVQTYQQKKDALLQRIEVINHLKQNQKTAAEAVEKLSSLDVTSFESVAVVDGRSLVINTPAGRLLR